MNAAADTAPNLPPVNRGTSLINVPPVNRVTPVSTVPSAVHHLDDLVAQLNSRSQQWRADWNELQESKHTIQTLRATTSQQASRIGTLEKALREIEQLGSTSNGTNEVTKIQPPVNWQPPVSLQGAMPGTESSYVREIAELKEQNEELQEIIKNQEEDVQNAVYLQERNRLLEQQLAGLTAESSSTYDTLAALAATNGTPAYNQSTKQLYPAPPKPEPESSLSPDWMASYKVKCDRCRQKKQVCMNPGGPCHKCQKAGRNCTFTLQIYHNAEEVPDAVAKARQANAAASQFLQHRPDYSSPYLNGPQDQYRLQKQVPRGLYSPQPPLQSPYAFVNGMSSSTSQSVTGKMKQIADIMLASASRPPPGAPYASPYSAK